LTSETQRQTTLRERFPIGASTTLADLGNDPRAVCELLRADEPVSWFAHDRVWIVASHVFVDEVLRDQKRFVTDLDASEVRQLFGVTMLTVDGPEHRCHHAPFARNLRRRALDQQHSTVIRSSALAIAETLWPQESAELMSEFAEPLAFRTVADVLGFDLGDDAALGAVIAAMAAADRVEADDAAREKAAAARANFEHQILATLERAPFSAPESVIASAVIDPPSELSDHELANNVLNLVFGGIDPTASMIGTAVWALLRHPQALAEVREDPGLLPQAIEEAARLHPPFGVAVRYVGVDTTFSGADMRAGDKLYVLTFGANRDGTVFAEPDRFDVHRSNLRLSMSFGRGLHFCIGDALAKLTSEAAVEAIFAVLPGLRLTDPEATPSGISHHKLDRLDVTWSG
jgi:cytochrome P450